jgi:hypothetical protein
MTRALILLTVIALLTSPVWVTVLALEPLPRVLASATLSVDDVENAKRLLRENDPRRLLDGERKRVVLTEREVNLLLRYAVPDGAAARAAVSDGVVTLAASTPVPANPFGSYVNADLLLVENGQSLEPLAIRVGRISLPGWLARGLTAAGNGLLTRWLPEYGAILDSLESLEADENTLAVTYQWQAAMLEKLRDRGRALVVSEDQQERILAYYAMLAQMSPSLAAGVSLAEVLGPLFAEAARRSAAGADPEDENRALILALGLAIQGTSPNRLNPDGVAPVQTVRRLPVALQGRRDLAQHFTISAALAAGAGGKLADLAGVFKELSDSQGGSGFSFPDLLADRAGVVFAQRATGNEAHRIQGLLAGEIDESVFMPPIGELPEGLQNLEFRRRYRDVDTEAYDAVKGEVERRIEALALYR